MKRIKSAGHDREEEKQTVPGLLPKPTRPVIAEIRPSPGFEPDRRVPVVPFGDDAVLSRWLVRCPTPVGSGEAVAKATKAGKGSSAGAQALRRMRLLDTHHIVHESWPDLTDAVDLHALSRGQPRTCSLFHTVLEVPRPTLVRVCHGAAGLNTCARMWISGREMNHGSIARLGAGLHPIVMEVYNGHDGTWVKWDLSRLATRFTVVTEGEIDEVFRWRLKDWEFTRDAASMDEAKLLCRVKIDPKTLRGSKGFIRVGRSTHGRWWLVAPDGTPFHHRGSTGLNAGGIGGRRAGLPPVKPATVRKWLGLLKAWGFNAMGAWTTPEFFEKGMPYTETIEGYYVEPWLDSRFPDVFDPLWAKNLDAKCAPICSAVKDSRLMIGYFLDNERGFMEFPPAGHTIDAKSPTYRREGPLPAHGLELAAEPKLNIRGVGLLQYCLSQKAGVPAGEKAWDFVTKRHGSVQGVGRAWGIALASRDDVRRLAAREEILISKSYIRDLHDFVALWVNQYFRVFTATIRRYDPNHLILGMRHGGTPAPVTLSVERRWTDVISQNSYRAEFMESFDTTYRTAKTPILDGEFNTYTDSYSIVRNPIEPPGGYDAVTRWQIRGQTSLDNVARHPGIVGYTMYRWNGHGNDDKLWNSKARRPNVPVTEELMRINYRSPSLAAESDRAPAGRRRPFHGQYFMCLEQAAMFHDALPAPKAGMAPSVLIAGKPLHLGFVCRHGRWDRTVYGDGIRGEVLRQKTKAGLHVLTIRIKSSRGIFTRDATAEFTLRFGSEDAFLRGTYAGQYNGIPSRGVLIGYMSRPVPTVKL